MTKNQTTDDQKIRKATLEGFFSTEEGEKFEFKIKLWPAKLKIDIGGKFSWLENNTHPFLGEKSTIDLLDEIEERSQACSRFYGQGVDHLGSFTVGFEIYDNQTPAVGLGKEPRENNEVVMYKKYDDNKRKYVVLYVGQFKTASSITGQWFFLEKTGQFEIDYKDTF